ncbi:MAG: glycosyltransferase, partial [Pseudomonadota bacterium]
VLRAICAELRREGLKGSIWLGSKTPEDEAMVEEYLQLIAADLPLELRIVRQSASGKRNAIADILKCMAREGLGQNHFVAFMDSDFILFPGALRRALPLFARDPELHAVTTDEECVVKGPQWIRSWLNMRFAQRRIGMMSHALSDRVLTLTGRFSIFRTTHILEPDFIETVQNDRLRHWLWGEFKFLSGDDKSTWYALLRLGVRMAYVPDATGYTLESIEGSGVKRMTENLLRWSGNMLRNGARAIALGPRRMPFFIWWCLVDQRLAMWTMLFGPAAAIVGTFAYGPWFLVSFLIYVALTRLMMSIILWSHSSSVDFNYVWCLYANQLLNAAVKIFVLWRLPRQRWMNRGDQRAGFAGGGVAATLRQGMAGYLTVLSVGFLLFAAFLAVSSTGVTATTLRMMLNL